MGDSRDEAQLISLAQGGDPQALEELLTQHQATLYRFSLRMCRDPEDAKDVLQDTLFSAVRSLGGFRGQSKFSSWLYAIARNHCIKRHTRRPPATDAMDTVVGLEAQGPQPEEQAGHRELLCALDSAVHVLDKDNRAVLLLRDVEGLSAAEVASSLEMSVPQVKSRLHRARLAVREHMQPVLDHYEPIEGDCNPGCPDVVTMFSKFLEDEISPQLCTDMQDHIQVCDYCRTTCDSLKRTVSVCNAAPTPQVPRGVQVALRHEIRKHLGA